MDVAVSANFSAVTDPSNEVHVSRNHSMNIREIIEKATSSNVGSIKTKAAADGISFTSRSIIERKGFEDEQS